MFAAAPRFTFTTAALAAAALAAGCASGPAPGSRSVTIERTTYGIAHVTATDYEGLGPPMPTRRTTSARPPTTC